MQKREAVESFFGEVFHRDPHADCVLLFDRATLKGVIVTHERGIQGLEQHHIKPLGTLLEQQRRELGVTEGRFLNARELIQIIEGQWQGDLAQSLSRQNFQNVPVVHYGTIVQE